MRIGVIVCVAGVSFSLAGCGAFSHDPDGPGTPGPPVPLKQVVLNDAHGLWGGESLWLAEDGTAVVQVVSEPPQGQVGLWEKRYRRKVPEAQRAEIERLVGAHDFFSLKAGFPRTGVPDEAAHAVYLVAKDGRKLTAVKWAKDKRPRFDALADVLFGMMRTTEGRELIHEGLFDWDRAPDGFEKPWAG